jgi:acyl-homoserine lactone acylase PvdQ
MKESGNQNTSLTMSSIIILIRIYRDKQYGIPHIHGRNLLEGYYGLGFVHA